MESAMAYKDPISIVDDDPSVREGLTDLLNSMGGLPSLCPGLPPHRGRAMIEHGAYGGRIARSFHLDAAPTLLTTRLRAGQLAVTRLTGGTNGVGMTAPIGP